MFLPVSIQFLEIENKKKIPARAIMATFHGEDSGLTFTSEQGVHK